MIIHNYSMIQTDDHTLQVPSIQKSNAVTMLMSTRKAGSMTYIPNNGNTTRNEWLAAHGIIPDTCAGLILDHGKFIHIIDSSVTSFDGMHGDGIILQAGSKYAACAVTVADCVPIFLMHETGMFISILHSGYKGTGILANALTLLTAQFGLPVKEIAVILGPHIQQCCYSVESGRAMEFKKRFGEAAVRESNGIFYLNLAHANIVIAENLGCKEIWVSTDCTSCNDVYGSYRREKTDAFTRMLALIKFPHGAQQ